MYHTPGMAPPPRGPGGHPSRVTEPAVERQQGNGPREPMIQMTTQDRESVFQMLHDPEVGNELVAAWKQNDGLLCAVLRVQDRHYCGYVQIPDWAFSEVDETVDRHLITDSAERFNIRPHGGITYGPDNSGWVGFDTAHHGDINVDSDGNLLPNHLDEPSFDSEFTIEWTPLSVKSETQYFADALANLLWELREGNWID